MMQTCRYCALPLIMLASYFLTASGVFARVKMFLQWKRQHLMWKLTPCSFIIFGAVVTSRSMLWLAAISGAGIDGQVSRFCWLLVEQLLLALSSVLCTRLFLFEKGNFRSDYYRPGDQTNFDDGNIMSLVSLALFQDTCRMLLPGE